MSDYSFLLGKRVEAHYRAGDIPLTVIGSLALDTGSSIFVEERFSHGGRDKTIRVEIPYAYILRVREIHTESGPPLQRSLVSSK
jgi:hypothetical protein